MMPDIASPTPAVIEPKPVHLNRDHENRLDDDQRLACVAEVAEYLARGERSTQTILEVVARHMPSKTCSRPTAIKYRNLALAMIKHESKPMNRENIRALEVGRYTYLIERIYKVITEFEESRPPRGAEDYLDWHTTWAKLWQRLDQFGARLHAITGINEITINNGDVAKRITFVRPGDKPIDSTDRPSPIAPTT